MRSAGRAGRSISTGASAFPFFLLLLLSVSRAPAHEQHPVPVQLMLSPDTYELLFEFDVPALMLSKTLNHTDPGEAAARLRDLGSEARAMALSQAERFFRINLKVEIDGKRQNPDIELPSFEPGPLGRLGDAVSAFQVRVAGTIPNDAQSLQLAPGRAMGLLELEAFDPSGSLIRRETLPGGLEGDPIAIPREGEVRAVSPVGPGGASITREHFVRGLRGIMASGGGTLLFLAALLLLAPGWRPAAGQFTAFIAACLLMLGLAGRGYLHVPGEVVQPLAVATAGVLALESLCVERVRVWRPSMVFAFGGVHGVALAAPFTVASSGQGPTSSRPELDLLVYALGAAVGLVLAAGGGWGLLGMAEKRVGPSRRSRPLSGLILGLAMVWTIQRLISA